ncbi:hypothetical protein H6G45_06465 [Synechocystis sp. FACHB-383]|uniref:hypothetical protein n=1 Tax=Synechocystis sp. FACHB-383 TaxID=2692864 RepID=UPI001683B409|nr:hypothetical protein [Synechocystis sp. FACHB-383]MBD2653136.1 hypothetical protein [Synechocystis sp. FACHB-383]
MELIVAIQLTSIAGLGAVAGWCAAHLGFFRPDEEITVETNFKEMAETFLEADRDRIGCIEIKFIGGDRRVSLICMSSPQRFNSAKNYDLN